VNSRQFELDPPLPNLDWVSEPTNLDRRRHKPVM
jgi:hypothetical protein